MGKRGHYKSSGLYIYIYLFFLCVCVEKKMKIINWEQNFLYTTEYYLQLREWSMLVIGCHT